MYKRIFIYTGLVLLFFANCAKDQVETEIKSLNRGDISTAQKLLGLQFSRSEIDSMIEDLNDNLASYHHLRQWQISNAVSPALHFRPLLPPGSEIMTVEKSYPIKPPKAIRPENIEAMAFYTIPELGHLLRSGQITSLELTQMYLARLKRYDPKLHCVITLTEELALEQARRADAELAAGIDRGPLHGIPYGAKDLLAKKGYKTTWGAMPYKDQIIPEDATVIRKLEEAGAVLVAKLTLGALAWGDVWFGEQTRNPWNPVQGSSGSSAGSASAVAAGLVGFAIGTETWGSIVSPCTRCGATGLRPTFGLVGRSGAMALSWSMDKIGPICRCIEDCALVLEAIAGPDPGDPGSIEKYFRYNPDHPLGNLRIGYLPVEFDNPDISGSNDSTTLEVLREMGITLIPLELPDFPYQDLAFILSAEAAAAFEELTLSGRDTLLVRQVRNAWPNVFRASRFIPAVEYIQANRRRSLLMEAMQQMMSDIDVYIAPSFSDNLLLTNLTGHPCIVMPNGFNAAGSPTSISFIGHPLGENKVIALARAYQQATQWTEQQPPEFRVE